MHILLCDDDVDTIAFMKHILVTAGCTVATTPNGYQALKALRMTKFDGVVADYRMSNGDGGMLSYYCKESAIPCLVVTGRHPDDIAPYLAPGTPVVEKTEFSALSDLNVLSAFLQVSPP